MAIYSNIPGVGQSAPQSVLDSIGADLIITPISFPVQMLSGHIHNGAMFCAVYEEMPMFDNGYDDVLERLMIMQRMGLSTQQSVLLLGIDVHTQLRQALYKDFWRAWASLGGRVEIFIKGALLDSARELEMTVPVPTAEHQFLQALPDFDARLAQQMLDDWGNKPILPLLMAMEQNGDGVGFGVNRQAVRNFVGLSDRHYLIQGEHK